MNKHQPTASTPPSTTGNQHPLTKTKNGGFGERKRRNKATAKWCYTTGSGIGVESRSHERSVRLKAVHSWCVRLTLHLLCSRGLAPLDHLGEGLAHRQPLITAKVASRREHPTKREGHATHRIHSYAALDTMIQSATKQNFHVPSLCFDRSSILPVFKRPAACVNPSRQSFAQPVYVLLHAPPDLLCLALLDTAR